jgi:hypothetical protein
VIAAFSATSRTTNRVKYMFSLLNTDQQLFIDQWHQINPHQHVTDVGIENFNFDFGEILQLLQI